MNAEFKLYNSKSIIEKLKYKTDVSKLFDWRSFFFVEFEDLLLTSSSKPTCRCRGRIGRQELNPHVHARWGAIGWSKCRCLHSLAKTRRANCCLRMQRQPNRHLGQQNRARYYQHQITNHGMPLGRKANMSGINSSSTTAKRWNANDRQIGGDKAAPLLRN